MALTVYVDSNTFEVNPGPCAIGAIVTDAEGRELIRTSRYIGNATNNVGEWTAVIEGCRLAKRLPESNGAKMLTIKTDSQLVARQISGRYRVKSPGLQELAAEWERVKVLPGPPVTVEWAPREETEPAHDEAVQALARAGYVEALPA